MSKSRDEEARAQAEVSFQKASKAKEATAIPSQIEQRERAVDEKTARLKAQRLARDIAGTEPVAGPENSRRRV